MKDNITVRNIKNLVLGFLAGLASLMPGISGGTILVISNKYDRLLVATNNLMCLKISRAELKFLLWILGGAGLAILLLTQLMAYLLTLYESTILVLFVGLILGGAWILHHQTDLKRPGNLIFAISTFLITAPIFQYLTKNVVSQNIGFPIWYLLLGGAFAAFCWVLPGISGSATLVMLGLYQPAMAAILALDLGFLLPFGLGAVLGGLICVKGLVVIFDRYRQQGMAILLGLTLGGVWGMFNMDITLINMALILVGFLISLFIEKVLS